MNLTLAKSEMFGSVQCDFWKNENSDLFMTAKQLGGAIGYADPQKGMDNLLDRNPHLKTEEFSVTLKMRGTDGKMYDTRVFNEDGIYESTMLAKTPKAFEFRSFVRKILKGLRKGTLTLMSSEKQQELEIKRMNAEARLLNAKTRQAMIVLRSKDGKTLHPKSVELLEVNALEVLTGQEIAYRPEVKGRHYYAEEIAKEAGVSKNKVGRVANANQMKTEEYGMYVLDKSRTSDKQVQVFKYNEEGRAKLLVLLRKK